MGESNEYIWEINVINRGNSQMENAVRQECAWSIQGAEKMPGGQNKQSGEEKEMKLERKWRPRLLGLQGHFEDFSFLL